MVYVEQLDTPLKAEKKYQRVHRSGPFDIKSSAIFELCQSIKNNLPDDDVNSPSTLRWRRDLWGSFIEPSV